MPDRELRAEEKCQIEHAGPGDGAVAAWKTTESIVDNLDVRIRANRSRNQGPAVIDCRTVATYSVLLDTRQIRNTCSNGIRPRLAKKVLGGLRDAKKRLQSRERGRQDLFPAPTASKQGVCCCSDDENNSDLAQKGG